jgi:hypothetical protein
MSNYTWTFKAAPVSGFNVWCCSNDGRIVVGGGVADNSPAYVSYDYATTWVSTDASQTATNFNNACMSYDGSVILLGPLFYPTPADSTNKSGYCISTDGGSTWSLPTDPSAYSGTWAACSYDGSKMVSGGGASSNTVEQYTSSDVGDTWTKGNLSKKWRRVEMSSTGQFCVAAMYNQSGGTNDYVYVSSNYGVDWTQGGTVSTVWETVDICDDGSTMFAARSGNLGSPVTGMLYRSLDFGRTWDLITPAPGWDWQDVVCSHDGGWYVAGRYTDSTDVIITSTNKGLTWATEDVNVVEGTRKQIIMSGDGRLLYTYSDSSVACGTINKYNGGSQSFMPFLRKQ